MLHFFFLGSKILCDACGPLRNPRLTGWCNRLGNRWEFSAEQNLLHFNNAANIVTPINADLEDDHLRTSHAHY